MASGQPFYRQQPYPTPQALGAPARWSTGLCGCCEDTSSCCLTCFCPCITFGRIAEIADQGAGSCGTSGALYALLCGLTGCQWIYSCTYRSRMRKQYYLADDPCNDCCVHFCCETCALCQEYRELKNRGFDPALGWAGNLARQAPTGVPIPPPVHGGMMR